APAGGRSWQRPPLQAATLATGLPLAALQRASATSGIAAGDCPLRPNRERCLRAQAPAMPAGGRAYWRLPLQGALAVADRPFAGGLGRSRLPLAVGLTVGRSYIPVFQIWIEKMKEVKRPPL
ncbi:hypothetical protein B296_00044794, partial [Ensete ventricosum]